MQSAIETIVRDVLRELEQEGVDVRGAPKAPAECAPSLCKPRSVPAQPLFEPREIQRLKSATPARIAQGRTGTRYLTDTYIQLRAEHAIALDAVHSILPDDLATSLGALALDTRAESLEEFLLFPEHGRRLSDASKAHCAAEATRDVDVQIIAGDGLAAWALLANGPILVPALQRELAAAGFKVGKPLLVRRARVGVQDEIGVLTGARSTIILVGERPGLGTGDSLSIYTAFGPKLDQDNAEKDCISNIRPLGLPPEEAARECAALLRRTFEAGGGGVKLVRSGK